MVAFGGTPRGRRANTHSLHTKAEEGGTSNEAHYELSPLLSPSLARLLEREREREAGERVNIVRGRITSEEGEEVSVFFSGRNKRVGGEGGEPRLTIRPGEN